MKKSLVLILLSFSVAQIFAQAVTYDHAKRKAKDFFDEGNNAYAFAKTNSAIASLKESIQVEPKFVDAYWLLGNIYFDYVKNFDSAIICFDKVNELKPDFHPQLELLRGQSYMYATRYQEAKKIFVSLTSTNLRESEKKQVDNYIKSCDFAEVSIKNPKKFTPINLGDGVNTNEEELMPSVTADERFLYFTRHEKIGRATDENIFMSENISGQFQQALLVDRPISTDEYLEGATCVSPSGKYLFFTSCGRPDAVGDCDIYYSKKIPGGWDRPKNMGDKVNSRGWDIQPCLSADGKTVYFASRRQGGYGGLDIYMTTLGDDFTWTTPLNMGPTINTEKDEQRPFIHTDDKTLYFSSDGHPGFGSSDFFYSKRDASGSWAKPINLGYPINTPGDEIGIFITTDGNTAYIGSERPEGKGGLDIYKFDMDESIKPQQVTYVKGHVFDESTKAPLKTTILLYDLSNSGKQFSSLTSDQLTGEYLATLPYGNDYAYHVNKEGYLFYSANFTLKDFKKNEPYQLDIFLKKIEVGNTVILNNIFFETNKFDIREESKTELTTLLDMLTKNPNLKIEIGGHTDNSGLQKDNQALSESRAKAVYEYLISKGVSAERLSYKGYAASKPIADNSTNEGKAKNRRTEFVVTGI